MMELILTLHARGKPLVESLGSSDRTGALARAVIAARVHGSSYVFIDRVDTPNTSCANEAKWATGLVTALSVEPEELKVETVESSVERHVLKIRCQPNPGEGMERKAQDQQSLAAAMEAFEKQFIEAALQRHNGDREKVADALGISPTTLWRRMTRLEIVAPPK